MKNPQVLNTWALGTAAEPTPEIQALIEIQQSLVHEAVTLQNLLRGAGIAVTLSTNQPFARIFDIGREVSWAKTILADLRTRVEITRSALEGDIALDDNVGLFWVACRKFNMRPDAAMLEKIERDDVLEIYSLELKQIFSNFEFWKLVSYPIDVILTHEFYELFDRPQAVNTHIFNSISTVLSTQRTIDYKNEEHFVHEIDSLSRYCFKMQHRFLGPLKDRSTEEMSGLVSTLKTSRVAQG